LLLPLVSHDAIKTIEVGLLQLPNGPNQLNKLYCLLLCLRLSKAELNKLWAVVGWQLMPINGCIFIQFLNLVKLYRFQHRFLPSAEARSYLCTAAQKFLHPADTSSN